MFYFQLKLWKHREVSLYYLQIILNYILTILFVNNSFLKSTYYQFRSVLDGMVRLISNLYKHSAYARCVLPIVKILNN